MEYLTEMESLTEEQRLTFYECLAHELTVAARDVWSSEQNPMDKVDQLKYLNEILHRVTAKVTVLGTRHHDWSESDSWADIEHWISQDRRNETRALLAVSAALRIAKSQIAKPTRSVAFKAHES